LQHGIFRAKSMWCCKQYPLKLNAF
jgi:hypothetical protein